MAALCCALFFAVGSLALDAETAYAQTFERWVAPAPLGNDNNNCTRTVESPTEDNDLEEDEYDTRACATLTRALSVANSGDIIYVAGGTYGAPLTIVKDLTIIGGMPLVLYDDGWDFERVPAPSNNPAGVFTHVSGGGLPGITVQNFPISGTAPMRVTLDGLRLSGSSGSGGGALRIVDAAWFGDISLVDVVLDGDAPGSSGGGLFVQGFFGASSGRTTVSMEGGAIQGSNAASGGGAYVAGTADVELLDVTVQNNTASSGHGGGIYVTGNAVLVYNGGLVHGNSATNGDGGGIYATGIVSATLGGLTLTNNSAARGGALGFHNAAPTTVGDLYMEQNSATGLGGAVYVEGSTFTLGSSTFATNTVTSGHGGGLAVNVRSNSVFTLTSSLFQGNRALLTNDGGGLWVTRTSGTQGRFVLNGGVEFLANVAQRGGGAFVQTAQVTLAGADFNNNTANSQGGGLFVSSVAGGTAVTGANFAGNSAASGGGLYGSGNFGLTGPNFISNIATSGGGIYLTGNTVSVTGGAFFQQNSATSAGGGAYLTGGAVLNAASFDALDNFAPNGGGAAITDNARLAVSGAVLLQNNAATTGNGGGIHISNSSGVVQTVGGDFAALSNTAAQQGGAIYAENGQIQLNSGTLQSNETTSGAGGGVYLTNSTLTGTGALTFSNNEAGTHGGALAANPGTLNFQGAVEVVDNRAPNGRGGGLALVASSGAPRTATFGGAPQFRNNLAGHGGGIYAEYVTLNFGAGTLFEQNGAQHTTTGHGGALYLVGAALTLDNITFDDNNAFVNGGALYVQNANLTAGAGARWERNRTLSGDGGALYYTATGGQITLNGAVFAENLAANRAGALYVAAGNLTANTGSQFTGNEADNGAGGAIYMQDATATAALTGVTFQANRAGGDGGGLYAQVANLTMNAVTLAQNAGGARGGGLFAQATNATVQNSTLQANWAAEGGGAYLLGPGLAQWTGNTVAENQASNHGGGLYLLGVTLGLNASDLRQNVAQADGGAIYALYSRAGLTNTVAAQNSVTATVGVGGGIWARNSALSFAHVTLADHTHIDELGSAAAIFVETPQAGAGLGGFSTPAAGSVSVQNSIVANNQIGLYLLPGNQATLQHSLWQNSRFDWTGDGNFAVVTANRRGDPRFMNAGQGDYRIRRESAAFDIAAASTITADKIGVSRNQGFAPDAGAFEHRYARGLVLRAQVSPPFARSGDSVVYSVRVRNSSSQTVNNVQLNATLPSTQPTANINGESCQTFCSVNLGNIAAGQEVVVEITAQVQGTPPATGLGNMNANLTLQADNFGPADAYGDSDKTGTARSHLFACNVRFNGSSYPTVQAAVDAAPGDGSGVIQVAGYCGDVHTNDGPGQAVTLDKSVTIQGGWNSDFSVRNPATTPSTIDAGGLGRTVYVAPGVAPTLQDIQLRGGATNGLGGGLWGKDAGGGLYVVNAGITLDGVDIANSRSDDLGGGVYIHSDEPIVLARSAVRQNEAGDRGGGLFIAQSDPHLVDMNIAGNRARAGGGLYLYQSAPTIEATVAGPPDTPACRIDSNVATGSPLWRTPLGSSTFWLGPGGGGGIFLDNSPASVARCSIRTNQARSGGGVYVHRVPMVLQQSLLTGNLATGPILSSDGEGGGLYVMAAVNGLALNSNFFGFNDAVRGSGLFLRLLNSAGFTLRHSTIAHNLGTTALYATGSTNLNMQDSIVAFNAGTGIYAASVGSNGATVALNRTLWHENTVSNTGSSGAPASVATQNDFSGDPAFFNDGYRIKRISAAYGRGGEAAALADRDGDARPQGALRDLGADEYAPAQFVRYVATNGNDANAPCADYLNPCRTLQAALDAASAGDLIKVAGGEYGGVQTRNGHSQIAYIEKSVTIQGGYFARTDTNSVTDGIHTLYDWEQPHPDESPTILNAALQGRVLTIVSPQGQSITPRIGYLEIARGQVSGVGGGVLVDAAHPLFEAVLVRENRATQGGGFYLRNSNGELRQMTIRANNAESGQGGGIYIEGGTPTLHSLTVETNVAITGAGVYVGGGGAQLVQNTVQNNGNAATGAGGGLYLEADSAQVLSNTVTGNQARHGGGLYLADSQARLQGNTIGENVAAGAGGAGGGIYVTGGAPVLVANLVRANRANPEADGRGGGLFLAESDAQLRQNEVAENVASAGGGLYLAAVQDAVVEDNLVRANRAETGNLAQGGGFVLNGGTLTLTLNRVVANLATRGGGLALVCHAPECTDATGARSALVENQVLENRAAQHGGGLYIVQGAPTLTDNTLARNQTQQGNGAGAYLTQTSATLTANMVEENLAGLGGGGLYLEQDGSTVRGGVLRANRANRGGGLYLQNLPGAANAPLVTDVEIVGNRAASQGGGLYAQQSVARVQGLQIHQNQAIVDGGGVFLEESVLRQFEGNLIAENRAGAQGGGVVFFRRSNTLATSNAIVDNVADSEGGGIAILGASPILAHTTLARNEPNGVVLNVADNEGGLAQFYNSIIVAHDVGVRIYAGIQAELDYTLFNGNQTDTAGATAMLLSTNEVAGGPGFANDGFRLQAGSAAVDAGGALTLNSGDDIDGQARVQGGGPDLGAHELLAPCNVVRAANLGVVYNNVQAAIDAAGPGSEIRIAGTCRGLETRNGRTQLAYIDKNLILRGGYVATAWNAEPNPDQYPTVLDARNPNDAEATGRAVYVAPNTVAVLENLTLYYGDATGQGGGPDVGNGATDAGGNLLVDGVDSITLRQVDFRQGRADYGGGLYVRASGGEISAGEFVGNRATAQGGGFYLEGGSADLVVRDALLRDNSAAVGGGGAVQGGNPTITNNRFEQNQALTQGTSTSGLGGGLYAAETVGALINNQFYQNLAQSGGALYVTGGAAGSTPTIFNIMAGRNRAVTGSAFYIEDAPVNLRHNTLVDNAGTGNSATTGAVVVVGATTSVDFEFTNNIVVGHGVGLVAGNNSRGFARNNIWFQNQTRWTGTISEGQGNQAVTPGLRDRAGGDYFLTATSAAIDQGVNAGVSIDIENRPRPARLGYDIGAHEYLVAQLTVTLFALPNPVGTGQTVGLLAQVVNSGDVDLVAEIVVTLPPGLTTNEPLTFSGVVLNRGESWTRTIGAAVGENADGTLEAVLAVTSDVGVNTTASTGVVTTDSTSDILDITLEATPSPVPAGSEIQYRLRVGNGGGVPLDTNIQVSLPAAIQSSGQLAWNTTIAGPDGAWTTLFTGIVAADAPDTLPVTVQVVSTQGPSAQQTIITELAKPRVEASIIADPAAAQSGAPLTYRFTVSNTGNVPLNLTITPTLATQVAATDLSLEAPYALNLAPNASDTREIPGSVETGYVGTLTTQLLAVSTQGVAANVDSVIQTTRPTLTPTKTATGGNWHDGAAWSPPGVPDAQDWVLIPPDVTMIAERPIEILGLRNNGELVLRGSSDAGVQTQRLQIGQMLENFGLIRGEDGAFAGAPGVSLSIELDIQAGSIYNEGVIRAGNGAPDGGDGGTMRLAAGSITNNGTIRGGSGADVTNPGANVPGGRGGGIFVTVEPGQLVNRGLLVAGDGGAAHPDADPPQPGGRGGDIMILDTSRVRLDGSELRAGAGGAGSQSNLNGSVGEIGIGAPRVSQVNTDFSRGAVSIVESDDTGFGFAVLGPNLVLGRAGGGEVIVIVRIFNRSARAETYLITPLTVPTGWQFLQLPASVTVPAFKSQAVGVRLRPPSPGNRAGSSDVDSAAHAERGLRAELRVTAQRNAGLRVDVPIGIVDSFAGGATLLHLPQVDMGPAVGTPAGHAEAQNTGPQAVPVADVPTLEDGDGAADNRLFVPVIED